MSSPNQPDSPIPIEQARQPEPEIKEPDTLALQEEEHSHQQATHRDEQGMVGRVLGSRSEKPGNVAAIVIGLCFIFLFISFFYLFNTTTEHSSESSFFEILSALISVISLALGYLFGSSDRR